MVAHLEMYEIKRNDGYLEYDFSQAENFPIYGEPWTVSVIFMSWMVLLSRIHRLTKNKLGPDTGKYISDMIENMPNLLQF